MEFAEEGETAEPEVLEVESVTAEVAPDWEQVESPSSVEVCKVKDGLPMELLEQGRGSLYQGEKARGSVGFPWVPAFYFPNEGELKFLMLLASFDDTTKFTNNPPEYLNGQAEELSRWVEFWSRGKRSWNIDVVDGWIDLPYRSTNAPVSDAELAEDIIRQLPVGTEIDDYDALFIQWAPGIEQGTRSKFSLRLNSLGSNSEDDSFSFRQMVWSTDFEFYRRDYEIRREFAWGSLIHEILHEMNMNLHAPGNGWATTVGTKTTPRSDGVSYAITAWEQFLLTWMEDSQVHCVAPADLDNEQTVILTPLEIYEGERKALVIPISESDVLVVESRRPIGYSKWWNGDNSGLLAYTVNPQIPLNRDHIDQDCGNDPTYPKWAYYLFPDQEREDPSAWCGAMGGAFHPAVIDQGETLSHNGIRIELVFSGDDKDYVRVTRPSDNDPLPVGPEPLEPEPGGGWWNDCDGDCPFELPNPAENIGHRMPTREKQVPKLESCDELSEQWGLRNGIAAGIEFRDRAGGAVATMISTQWYAKNRALDTNLDGVICSCYAPESGELEDRNINGVPKCIDLQADAYWGANAGPNASVENMGPDGICDGSWWRCIKTNLEMPRQAENSDHGKPVDDPNRIGPPNCDGLRENGKTNGIAASFDYRQAAGTASAMVSTEWYVKLAFLDTNLDGIVCGPGDNG